MSSVPVQAREDRAVGRTQWVTLSLLVLSVCINYVDRGNLSVAAHDLSTELHLDPLSTGQLLSAFFWTYASFQIVAGWLIDRYNVNWVYAAGFFLWSLATALTGLVNSFATLFAVRLLLGISESVAYPSYSKIICRGFPEKQRGIANALIDAGSKLGPAVGVIVGGLILVHFGWRMMFVAIGTISLAWLIPWCWINLSRPLGTGENSHGLTDSRRAAAVDVCAPAGLRPPGFRELLRQRSAWGTFLGLFAGNYAWYFLLTWLPSYLIMERHYSTEKMAWFGSLPFWAVAASTTVNGYLSDRWISRGGSPTRVRKTFVVSGLLLSTLMLPAALIQNQVLAMATLMAAWVAYGLFSSNVWAITQTLAGPVAAGKWTGMQNAVGNLAGVAAPWVTGYIVKQTGHFFYAFVSVCVILLMGAVCYLFVVGPVKETTWSAAGARPSQ